MDAIKPIILRFLRGELQAGDRDVLDSWIAQSPANQALLDELQDAERVGAALARIEGIREEAAWERFHAYVGQRKLELAEEGPPTHNLFRRLWWVAAVIIPLLGTGIWWMVNRSKPVNIPVAVSAAKDVPAPKTNRATLTLSSGQQVYLDSAGNGQLASEGKARIRKDGNGRIAYLPEGGAGVSGSEVFYNTLTNPRGSQVIHLTLSDGTKVWLNAESSIRYPVLFGSERTVEMTGEVYFEVAKNASKPFYVEVAGQEKVAVLGTSFNINSYGDETVIRTTLLEGAIRVGAMSTPGDATVLKPGQQAVVAIGTNRSMADHAVLSINQDVDLETVVAWKTGYFDFDQEDIQSILRQVARWYNIRIVYAGKPPTGHFSGIVSRSRDVSAVLHMFEQGNIHYTITQNEITILPH